MDMCKRTGQPCDECMSMAKMYVDDGTVPFIAQKYGVSRARVYNALKQTGTVLRGRELIAVDDELTLQIVEWRDEGNTWSYIANKCRMSERGVKKRYDNHKENRG